jgi:hypothetical protein
MRPTYLRRKSVTIKSEKGGSYLNLRLHFPKIRADGFFGMHSPRFESAP